MPSSITQREILELSENPGRLLEEIQRYQQLRDDTESKLRAVVDETTARELRELAERELHQARLKVEDADTAAGKTLSVARAEADRTIAQAHAEAEALTITAQAEAQAMYTEAARRSESSRALEAELQSRISSANRATELAERAMALNNEAASHHTEAAAVLDSQRQRLSALVKEMRGIVGDGQ